MLLLGGVSATHDLALLMNYNINNKSKIPKENKINQTVMNVHMYNCVCVLIVVNDRLCST